MEGITNIYMKLRNLFPRMTVLSGPRYEYVAKYLFCYFSTNTHAVGTLKKRIN